MKTSDLVKLKEKIETFKTEVSELKGKRSEMLSRLKKDYGCKNLESARKKVASLKVEVKELEEELERGMDQLEDEFDL
jgi:seryl-tRNA synthetase